MPDETIDENVFISLNAALEDGGQSSATNKNRTAPERTSKDPAAAALGRKGGVARAASMPPERRAEIARAAAAKRWKKF